MNKKNQDICLPRIMMSIPLNYIFKIISKLEVGKIEKIIETPNYSNPDYKKVIIKIKWNESSKMTQYIQSRFIEEKPVIIVYNNETFWKAFPTHLRQK